MIESIPFTQYLRPDGRKKPVEIVRPQPVMERAEAIMAAGYSFEIEELSNGMVSMTITGFDPAIEEVGDLAHELCMNGPDVPAKVDKLITDFLFLDEREIW